MAKRKRVPDRAAQTAADEEPPIDVAVIGQGVGTFETVNGMPNGIMAAVLVVITLLLVRPVTRALRAFLRG